MKRVLKEKQIMNKDILKLNQLVSIVSRAHYLHRYLSNSSNHICRFEFVDLLVKNFYLEGTLCWLNKEIENKRTYIEIENKIGEIIKFQFERGFTDFDLHFDVDIYNNTIYSTHLSKEIIDDVFNLIENGQHLYIDKNKVITNNEDYEGFIVDNEVQIYSTEYITNKLLDLPRFI